MRPIPRWQILCALLATASSCAPRAPPTSTSVALGGDVAHVADTVIPGSLVDRIARARGLTPSRALDGLVDDALLAQEGLVRGLDDDPSVRWTSTAALARVVSERTQAEAPLRGPPADDELATIRVMHALVHRSPTLTPSRAMEIALALRQAVERAKNEDEFETRARQVPHPGTQISVERLNACDASGRTEEGEVYDSNFVAGAFDLHRQGETSDVVETPFGWHVIRLVERTLPDASALDQRRRELVGDVLNMRVRAQLRRLLEGRRSHTPVEVHAGADELMAKAAHAP